MFHQSKTGVGVGFPIPMFFIVFALSLRVCALSLRA